MSDVDEQPFFAAGGSGPHAAGSGMWRIKAEGLYQSARRLWEAYQECEDEIAKNSFANYEQTRFVHGYFSSYLLLTGFAFELLIKAILVEQDPNRTTEVTNWKKSVEVNGHDLVGLSRVAKVDLKPGQEETLAFLTECITWLGRYPVELKHGDAVGWTRDFPTERVDATGVKLTCGERLAVFDNSLEGLFDNLRQEYLRCLMSSESEERNTFSGRVYDYFVDPIPPTHLSPPLPED